jgi:lipooligosaccharide transport system permease protein
VFRFIVLPMTLVAGTFFPVEQLPVWVRPFAWVTPLWHGTELSRGAAFGTWHFWPALGHVAYLVALLVVGLFLAARSYRRRLEI